MSTIEKLLAQKQQLMEELASDPGPNEREEIERLLAKIETALTLLEPNGPAGRGERGMLSTASIGTYLAVTLFPGYCRRELR
jgi:hypothetical protein